MGSLDDLLLLLHESVLLVGALLVGGWTILMLDRIDAPTDHHLIKDSCICSKDIR